MSKAVLAEAVLADWFRGGSRCWGFRQDFGNKWRVEEQTLTQSACPPPWTLLNYISLYFSCLCELLIYLQSLLHDTVPSPQVVIKLTLPLAGPVKEMWGWAPLQALIPCHPPNSIRVESIYGNIICDITHWCHLPSDMHSISVSRSRKHVVYRNIMAFEHLQLCWQESAWNFYYVNWEHFTFWHSPQKMPEFPVWATDLKT